MESERRAVNFPPGESTTHRHTQTSAHDSEVVPDEPLSAAGSQSAGKSQSESPLLPLPFPAAFLLVKGSSLYKHYSRGSAHGSQGYQVS